MEYETESLRIFGLSRLILEKEFKLFLLESFVLKFLINIPSRIPFFGESIFFFNAFENFFKISKNEKIIKIKLQNEMWLLLLV